MIGKLFKFENRSSLRQMAVIWVALFASSILISISEFINRSFDVIPGSIRTALLTISSSFYGIVFAATMVFTIVIVVMRFYNGVCGDEGYLTHTLPVTARSIIISKGLSATLVVLISVIVAVISIIIIGTGVSGFHYADVVVKSALEMNNKLTYLLITLEAIVAIILGIMGSIYRIYASISIGQMANSHRIAWSVVAYIGINMIMLVLMVILALICDTSLISQWISDFNRYLVDNASEFTYTQVGVGALLLVEVVQLFIFHVITEIFLTRKLNLL